MFVCLAPAAGAQALRRIDDDLDDISRRPLHYVWEQDSAAARLGEAARDRVATTPGFLAQEAPRNNGWFYHSLAVQLQY